MREPRTIRLSRQEIETAKIIGMPLQEYARNKAALEDMYRRQQAEREAWLQTPAGIAYMEREFAKNNERKIKARERSKAYRAKKKAERMKATPS